MSTENLILSDKLIDKATGKEIHTDLHEIKGVLEQIAENQASAADHAAYDSIFEAMLDGHNTTHVFTSWAHRAIAALTAEENRYDLLVRWFTMLEEYAGNTTYTLRWYDDDISDSPVMTPMDDLADGRTAAQLCTDSDTAVTDWADEDPMMWYIRANAISKADGTMNVLAIEGVDTTFDISGELGPVYAFQMALWVNHHNDGEYNYKSWKAQRAANYRPYAGDVDPNNEKRVLTWHPCFPGGISAGGGLTSGAGIKPANRMSAVTGIAKARVTSAYEGLWCDCDTEWLLDMWQLRHWNLENSGIAEGCTNYNYQYIVALGENDVKRILLTPAQAANFLLRSSIMLGTHESGTNTDRSTAGNYDILDNVRVSSIEQVTVDDVTYGALYLDVDEEFSVPEGAFVSTAPWYSGETEHLPAHKDGSTYNLTNGRTPIRIAGIEVLDGTYTIGLDPLWNATVNADDNTKFDYEVFECRDSVNLAGSITANYVSTGIVHRAMATGWNWIKKFFDNPKGVLFPETFGGSSTGYYKSAFYGTPSAGVRAPWRFCSLASTTAAGLAGAAGCNTPSITYWNGRPRLSGSGKKRGEWAE